MSTNDKTRKKLVDSMRKTKESTTKKTEQAPAMSGKTEQNKVEKKEVTRNKIASTLNKVMIDPYQVSPRRWPD